ncbi:MAG: bifunctional adenosylcobinamide kinase/adenosylcobinamide-phosphate guanylyltransferase [Sphaerochaetaceae bacterium]|nr:bifunctional adenosylcobinamide kinase/adenosylcobinamide-phosphate guanylyltransferase [Sphaerochaetaceae bacterium]
MNHEENRVIFVVGGARSGKSRFGEQLALRLPGKAVYIATGEVTDEEMKERIARHQQRREGLFERTVEEPLDLAGAVMAQPENSVLLVDCLSVYLGNLFYHEKPAFSYSRLDSLYEALTETTNTIILISNEVGEGIVPDNEMSRIYRDAHGWMNQKVASIADVVIRMTCGIPQYIKGETL